MAGAFKRKEKRYFVKYSNISKLGYKTKRIRPTNMAPTRYFMARHYAEADKKRNSENGQSEPGF
jgi:hypothetical protein